MPEQCIEQSAHIVSSTLPTSADFFNIQPNFSQMLNMDSLSIQDTNESGFASSHTPAVPASSRKLSKKSDIFGGFLHSVKKNPEIFKSGRERLSNKPTIFCEVPDDLLAARAARIIMRRGNSHRPPPTRYIRRQRSSIEPVMVVTTFESTLGGTFSLSVDSTDSSVIPMCPQSANQTVPNLFFEVRFVTMVSYFASWHYSW